jgi:hypothetical protein
LLLLLPLQQPLSSERRKPSTKPRSNIHLPKTGWYAINPADLVHDTGFGTYNISTQSLSAGAESQCFLAGVHLPHGAQITRVTMWYQSASGSLDISFFFDRTKFTDGAGARVAFALTSDDSNTRKQVSASVPAAVATVDNSDYRYTFYVCPTSSDNRFHGARITYLYSNAGD